MRGHERTVGLARGCFKDSGSGKNYSNDYDLICSCLSCFIGNVFSITTKSKNSRKSTMLSNSKWNSEKGLILWLG